MAVVALIPQERGQDIQIRLGGFPARIIGLASAAVLYWAMLEPIHSLPGLRLLPRPIDWPPGWGPDSLSLALLLATTAFAFWIYRRRLPPSRMPKLAAAITNAIGRRRYGECIQLLDAHLAAIRAAFDARYWQARLRSTMLPSASELHLRALASLRANATGGDGPLPGEAGRLRVLARVKPWARGRVAQRVAAWLDRPRDAAHDIVRSISLAAGLVTEIAHAHPYLGVRLLAVRSSWVAREFAETYAAALVADQESALYRELRRAENIDLNNIPLVDPVEQPLLDYLCDDVVDPSGARLVYTFLEAGIAPIRYGAKSSLNSALNGPISDFHERGRWASPPFVPIYLFTVLAPRNALARDAPMLNLYQLDSLARLLLNQLQPAEAVDLTSEWPTPTHYLLYEIVSLLVDLIHIWRARPELFRPEATAPASDQSPHHLPEHAAQVLGSVMYDCLASDKLDVRYKSYLLEVWWRAYSDKYRGDWDHSRSILDYLVQGGAFTRSDMAHRSGVAAALDHVDVVTRYTEAADRLREAFGLGSTHAGE